MQHFALLASKRRRHINVRVQLSGRPGTMLLCSLFGFADQSPTRIGNTTKTHGRRNFTSKRRSPNQTKQEILDVALNLIRQVYAIEHNVFPKK